MIRTFYLNKLKIALKSDFRIKLAFYQFIVVDETAFRGKMVDIAML